MKNDFPKTINFSFVERVGRNFKVSVFMARIFHSFRFNTDSRNVIAERKSSKFFTFHEKRGKKEVLITQHSNGSSKSFRFFFNQFGIDEIVLLLGIGRDSTVVPCWLPNLGNSERHRKSHLLSCHVGSAFEVNLLVIGVLLWLKINFDAVPENVNVLAT